MKRFNLHFLISESKKKKRKNFLSLPSAHAEKENSTGRAQRRRMIAVSNRLLQEVTKLGLFQVI